MKANKSDLREIIEGSKQYILPLYQRRYSWQKKHWLTLKRDLDRLLDDSTRRSHFIGSLVTVPHDHAAEQSVARYRLIDGQQRLTTILILLCALRDVAQSRDEPGLANEIHGLYLSNQYKTGDAERKLIPLSDDLSDFLAVVRRPADSIPGRIGDAYTFFLDWLKLLTVDQLKAAKNAALGRLDVVNITLEHGDDPHLIFESLNAKGERLTQADLLRNYFLMRLPPTQADALYLQYWKPMQDRLGDDLTSFFRHFLMRDAGGAEVRKDEVYDHVKAKVDQDARVPSDVVNSLDDLSRHAFNYARLTSPNKFERDIGTADKIDRLHRLKITTAYPFLLNVMRSIDDGRLSSELFSKTLDLIETFLVRRAVVGIPTNQLRTIFRGLCPDAATPESDETFLFAVREALSHNQRCPSDSLFSDALIHRPLYLGSKHDLARYILERIEKSYGHKEATDPSGPDFQVEHVMPQTLTDEWKATICSSDPEQCGEVHDKWLHTIGNLTLTGYNATLSNQTFDVKREEFAASKFTLNDYFQQVDTWTPSAIEKRASRLANDALKIWPDFATPRLPSAEDRRRRQRVPVPTAIVVDGIRLAVSSNLEATHQVLKTLYERDANAGERALKKIFRRVRLGSHADGMRSPRAIGPLFVDLHGSGGWLQSRTRRFVKALGLPTTTVEYQYMDSMH